MKWILIFCLALSATLSAETKVLAFAGSTRTDSVNQKLVNEAAQLASQMGASVTVINLKDYPIPFYDADLEAAEGMPAHAQQLRQLMIQSEVILIASPDYNSSVPAVLKNVLDWASRSEEAGSSRDAYKGKKFGIMSASPGLSGGARGLIHLRTIITAVGGTVNPMQVSVPGAYNAFDEQGHLKNEELKIKLRDLVESTIN